jgi:hypothetical protein
VKSQRFVERTEKVWRELADLDTDALNCDRTHLLGLCLGIVRQAGHLGSKENLERVDPIQVRGHRNDRQHSSAETLCRPVCTVIADNDRWTTLVHFASPGRVEVNESHLASAH